MLDFLYKKNALTLKLIPLLVAEVTVYFAFISSIYWLLNNDTISIAILVLTATVPILCLFYLSTLRSGLLELGASQHMNTERLVPVTFKMTLFFWGLGSFALALSFFIWFPIITYIDPEFQISAFFSESLTDLMHNRLSLTKMGGNFIPTQLVYGTLLSIVFVTSLILQILFTIPLTSLAASLDGKSFFDPIRGLGLYFWSSLLTLTVGYVILAMYYIDIMLGASMIFHITLTPSMIINDSSIITKYTASFFLLILPISYLSALHSATSAKAYKRYANWMTEKKVAFVGAQIRPKTDSRNAYTSKLEGMDITTLRKMRERRAH